MFRRKKEPSEAQKAKDAREKKKLALFLTPNPPTPPLKKRTTRQPLKQGNAVLPRGVENDFAKDSESSSETSSASSDTSTSGSSSDKRKKTKRPPCQVHGVQRRSSRLRKHNEKADKSASDSVEECNLATPFIWTMEMLQKLMQYCAAEPH
ncbi:uncharacterized protein [Dermacentor albipictus]|uniref:uncharacterized protein isoform X10 n=1 Tax=Dermacentor albipictus TaxID=60249 RepID=UPI0031FC53AB